MIIQRDFETAGFSEFSTYDVVYTKAINRNFFVRFCAKHELNFMLSKELNDMQNNEVMYERKLKVNAKRKYLP